VAILGAAFLATACIGRLGYRAQQPTLSLPAALEVAVEAVVLIGTVVLAGLMVLAL
jgi:hypothetical protein